MRSITLAAIVSVAVSIMCGSSSAWAIGGGGLAPGGPMSGSVRPSCDGYNMDGTVNASPGAERPGCIDHSARNIRGPVPADLPPDR